MSSAAKIDDAPAVADCGLRVAWFFRLGESAEVGWDWRPCGTRPPMEQLTPVRMPRSSDSNRHIPVSAYSMTNGGVLHLESGLEHDLVRRLDRNPRIARLVAQPLRLSWTAPNPVSHIPDLLTVHDDDSVTVWDVRALEEQDDDFRNKSAVSRDACALVGWRYEVFDGLGEIERLNLLWLHGFRRRPAWAERFEEEIRRAAGCRNATIGDLFAHDDGTGELKAVVWHLMWSGVLDIDMAAHWELNSAVTTSRRGAQ
ncbi:MAG: hypothetical protein JWR34_329 [Mycobacterium sp.]|nr:hypothetical protein [Mycobacterium sp.]